MLERDVLRQVKDLLRIRGWLVFRIQQSMGSHKGMSDLIACKNGKTVFIEIKGTNGKLSYYQAEFRRQLQEESIPYWLINDIDQLKDVINY
jgi:Holliday junction resolvase